MTHAERAARMDTAVKLLAHGPLSGQWFRVISGWPALTATAVLTGLVNVNRITGRPFDGGIVFAIVAE